jgi:hypothetical protein
METGQPLTIGPKVSAYGKSLTEMDETSWWKCGQHHGGVATAGEADRKRVFSVVAGGELSVLCTT